MTPADHRHHRCCSATPFQQHRSFRLRGGTQPRCGIQPRGGTQPRRGLNGDPGMLASSHSPHRPLRITAGEDQRQAFTTRTLCAFLIVAALFSLLIGRLIWLMGYQHGEHLTNSENNRARTLPLVPTRGLIYDRAGRILAHNRPLFSIVVVPEPATDLNTILAEIATRVNLTDDEIAAFHARVKRQRRKPLQPIPLKRHINPVERAAIEVDRHRLGGVQVVAETVRHYPFGPLMAHAVGSVRRITEEDLRVLDKRRYQATRFVGKRGVEAFYEWSLHGEPGYRRIEVDVHGHESRELSRQRSSTGQNVTLHLDADLQAAASAALARRRGAVVAIEPATGGILAMVSTPGYDPNLFTTNITQTRYNELVASLDTPLLNRATQGRYAPGSTVKPIVGLAGLALGITDWKAIVNDRGEFKLPGNPHVYRDWSWTPENPGGQGIVNMRSAIYRSSNVYFYDLASHTKTDALQEFAAQFGFGRVTAVDVANADAGVLPDQAWKRIHMDEPWYPGDTLNLAIGQGDLLATPLQLATMTAIIANRGVLVPPRMLKSSDGVLTEFKPPASPRRIEGPSTRDWEQMVGAMEDVVHRGNRGPGKNGIAWAYIGRNVGYRMAGKSGTAQLVEIPQGEQYDEEKLGERQRKHAWFVAFAPVDAPRIAIAVLVENGGSGSSVAAPVAREILDAYLLPRMSRLDTALVTSTAWKAL